MIRPLRFSETNVVIVNSKNSIEYILRGLSLAVVSARFVPDLQMIIKNMPSCIQPDDLRDTSASDFFRFEVVGLAHKLLSPEQFQKDVKLLRKRCVITEGVRGVHYVVDLCKVITLQFYM